MGEFIDLGAKLKRYYRFTPNELKGMMISIVIISIVVAFDKWGADTFDLGTGLFNQFNALLIVTLAFLIHYSAQKVAALSVGYDIEYKVWSYGLLIAMVLALLTKGFIWFLIPGGIIHHHLAGHKLGFFRYGLNFFAVGLSAFMGPVANLFFVVILKIVNTFAHSSIINFAIVVNIWFAVWSVLPIPPSDGSRMFFGSRMVYAFGFCAVIAGALLLHPAFKIPIWFAVIGALLIGFICWL
ncbi:MAG: hypothetical protein KJ922_01750, partial [Nanoarchaeota archaeon]|nr:hypothetical protein [Nanoarchaeota archaeon]